MLCCVTPKEHLGLPNKDDEVGSWSTKLRAHAADLAKGFLGPKFGTTPLSAAHFAFRWEGSVQPVDRSSTARKFHDETLPKDAHKDARFVPCGTQILLHENHAGRS